MADGITEDTARRMAKARQWIAHQGLNSYLPCWDELTPDEQEQAETEARHWIRAAVNAGVTIVPACRVVVDPPEPENDDRWGDSSLGIRSTPDSGVSWQPARKILDNATGRPTAIAVNGTMLVVYREKSTGNAVVAYSVDNGQTWQPDGVVLAAPAGSPNGMTYAAMVPSLDPGKVRLVVGMEQADGTSDLWGGTVVLP